MSRVQAEEGKEGEVSEAERTGPKFRKLSEVTHIHFLHWHCPNCGQELAHLVMLNTITVRACPACAREFQINRDEVFVIEPL